MAVPGLARAGEAAEAAVTIASGPIRGQAADGLRRFLGIPYAAPPVGTLRWQPPQSVAAWAAPRDCTHFGPACPQPRQRPDGTSSEDCLTLNVWTPATRPGEKLPVMAAQAVKHGYNCLIFEGPGQGELIRIHKRPFRADWEKVVTPVVDFALKRPEVDPEKTALLGYSMICTFIQAFSRMVCAMQSATVG